MQESKRSLLKLFSGAAAFSIFAAIAQSQDPFPPSRQRPARPGEDDSNLPEKASTKAVLEENKSVEYTGYKVQDMSKTEHGGTESSALKD